MKKFLQGFFGVIVVSAILAIIIAIMLFGVVILTPYLTELGAVVSVTIFVMAVLVGIINFSE